jgi:hypothetical protein
MPRCYLATKNFPLAGAFESRMGLGDAPGTRECRLDTRVRRVIGARNARAVFTRCLLGKGRTQMDPDKARWVEDATRYLQSVDMTFRRRSVSGFQRITTNVQSV